MRALHRSHSAGQSVRVECGQTVLGKVDRPIAQTHAEMPKELLARTGLDDRLLRLSVGIEDADDLIADLAQALNG